jgi:hypothetical protein
MQAAEYYNKLTEELVIEMRKYEQQEYRVSHAKLIYLTLSSLKPIAQGMGSMNEVKMIESLLAKFHAEIQREEAMENHAQPSMLSEFLHETQLCD